MKETCQVKNKTFGGLRTIGGIPLDSPLILAPLAGVTNPPLRLFFKKIGAAAVHTEMVSCSGLIRENEKTSRMLSICPGEQPTILQLFAGDVETLVRGAEKALHNAPDRFAALGINMACPMPKVLKKGAGSRLLEFPEKAVSMVEELKKMGLPVWVKIRICPEFLPYSTSYFCEELLRAGADNICLHGRTPAQRYSGTANREKIAEIAHSFPGYISASGDVFSVEDVEKYLEAGCVTVFIARGALKDPFIFPQTLAALGFSVDNRLLCPSIDLKISMMVELGDHIAEETSPRLAEILVKRLLSGMFKGTPGIAEFRRESAGIHGWKEMKQLMGSCGHYLERREVMCRPM